ncbi:hypothetical protein HFP70_35455 [Streptomyces sp. ARC14]|uniref:hypothetical protein n=1 Tax=Streptomyces sp. ARC14 TaxID=2724152 RepID=UPI003857CF8D
MFGYQPPTVETVSIPLANVTVRRPRKRGDDYRLEFGRFVGRGSTLAAARADLANQIDATAASVHTPPAFARDDDGTSLIVAIDRPWGVDEYRITDAGHRLTGTYNREMHGPAEWLDRTHHYTPIPPRR